MGHQLTSIDFHEVCLDKMVTSQSYFPLEYALSQQYYVITKNVQLPRIEVICLHMICHLDQSLTFVFTFVNSFTDI